MILVLVSVVTALADTWIPWTAGFASPPRDDAPVDGVLLVDTNFAAEAWVVEGPHAPYLLPTEQVSPFHLAIHPPHGGWAPDATHTVAVLDYADYGVTVEASTAATLTFSTRSSSALPVEVLRVDHRVGAWREDTETPWGCCADTRVVTVHAALADGVDPWAWVVVSSQMETRHGVEQRAEQLGHGPGSHALEVVQWIDEDAAEVLPDCLVIEAFSASGEPGPSEIVCPEPPEDDTGCGCRATPGTAGWLLVLLGALAVRRSRQDDGGRAAGPRRRE